jgi:hypothetical protein
LLRDLEPIGVQVDVVRDERHPGPDDRRARGRVRRRRAVVGGPAGRRHLLGQPFELPAADVFEVAARRSGRGLLVQVDRDAESLRHGCRHLACQRDALGHGHALDWDERHDVHGAEPRVLAAMRTQVDVCQRLLEKRQRRGLERLPVAHEREDGTVVRGVGRVVEQLHAGNGAYGVHAAVDDVGPPPLADVRDGFDEGHSAFVAWKSLVCPAAKPHNLWNLFLRHHFR